LETNERSRAWKIGVGTLAFTGYQRRHGPFASSFLHHFGIL